MSVRAYTALTTLMLGCALQYGCATDQSRPTEELTKARSVIEQADKGNAQRYAAADLQRAHDELSNAERAASARKYDDARRFARKAEVDGDVATARGNSGAAQKAAEEVRQSIDTLKQESSRPTNNSGPNGSGSSGT